MEPLNGMMSNYSTKVQKKLKKTKKDMRKAYPLNVIGIIYYLSPSTNLR